MPLDKLVLILVCVIIAAAGTVWLGALVAATIEVPSVAWAAFIPAALVAYVVWRVIVERLSNSEDDHYDNNEK